MPYASRHTDTIAALIRDQGRTASDAAYRRSAVRGNAIANIGQLAAGTLRDLAQYKAEAPERARRARMLEREDQQFRDEDEARGRTNAIRDVARLTADPETGRIDTARAAKEISLIDPSEGMKWWNQADEEQKAHVAADKERAQHISQWAGALRGVPPPQRPALYATGRADLIANKVATADQIPEDYDEAWLTKTHLQALDLVKQLEALAPKEPKTRTLTSKKADGTTVEEIVEDVPGTTRESAPALPANVDAAIFEAYRKKDWEEYRRLLTVKAESANAGREPDKPTDVTTAQRGQAQRWKIEQLAALEKEYRESLVESPMPSEQLTRRKLDIENAYRTQIGLQPLAALPSGWGKTAPAAPIDEPAAAPSAPAGSTEKSVTVAELQAIATRRGTTVEQERARATAAGFVIR